MDKGPIRKLLLAVDDIEWSNGDIAPCVKLSVFSKRQGDTAWHLEQDGLRLYIGSSLELYGSDDRDSP